MAWPRASPGVAKSSSRSAERPRTLAPTPARPPLPRAPASAGDEVVEPCPDERAGQRGEADPEDVVGRLTPAPGDERRRDAEHHRTERDEQAVPVAAEGSEPQLRRAGTRHELPGPPRNSFGMVRNSHWGIV